MLAIYALEMAERACFEWFTWRGRGFSFLTRLNTQAGKFGERSVLMEPTFHLELVVSTLSGLGSLWYFVIRFFTGNWCHADKLVGGKKMEGRSGPRSLTGRLLASMLYSWRQFSVASLEEIISEETVEEW